MILYVNGAYAGQATDNVPMASNGPLLIGRDLYNGHPSKFATGSISDVRVFQRVLQPLDVADLYDAAPPQQPGPGAGAPSAYDIGVTTGTTTQAEPSSPDSYLNQTLLNEPNLRTVVVSLGANDVLNDEPMALIKQNLTAVIGPSRPFGLKNLLRPDGGNAVHVILTTVPPMGLAASDPREQVREQLNADIVANFQTYGADGVVDFDQAVAGSTEGQLASGTVTNGLPNATYYGDLAGAVLAAINTFPPKAQL